MIDFCYQRPTTLAEALNLLQQPGEHKVLAGGTDLVNQLKEGKILANDLVSLASLFELKKISKTTQGGLRIGAATTISDIIASPLVADFQPTLPLALATIGSKQIRNRATLGGNICNASPAADSVPLLLALGADVEITSNSDIQRMPLEQFFLGCGKTILQKGDLLTAILLPAEAGRMKSLYLKQGVRQSMDIAVASVAVALLMEGGICRKVGIGLGSVASSPIRSHRAEQMLLSANVPDFSTIAAVAKMEANPISDIRASDSYRREVVEALTKRAITILYSA